jgi:hypothetical protein
MIIGRTNGITTDFSKINLDPGWRFTKRTCDGRTLAHVCLTYDGTGIDVADTDTANGGTFADTQGDIYATKIGQAVAIGFIKGDRPVRTFAVRAITGQMPSSTQCPPSVALPFH